MRELQDAGTFTNLDKLKDLMAVARKDVVLSAGWDEDLIRRLGGLAGGSGTSRVEFRTLPVVRYETIDGQDVNIVDSNAIKAEVAAAIGAAPPTTATTTTGTKPNPSTVVDVINSGHLSGLASEVSHTLKKNGYTTGQVRDRSSGEPTATSIEYGPGADTDARNVAALLGLDTPIQPSPSLEPGHIRVTVDTNYSMPAPEESTTTTSTTSSTHSSYGYGTSTYPTPDQGKPIGGGGVPCVN
jgi:hypothetical protein